jgi:hypothetical protein
LVELDADGRVILPELGEPGYELMKLLEMAQYRDQWRA